MEWLKKELEAADEAIIFMTRPHWSMFLLPLTAFGLAFVNWWLLIPALVLLCYDIFIFCSHQFIVTDRRIIQKKGLYYIRTKEWPLQRVEDVICSRTVADRLMGSGSVVLMGISISKAYLRGVRHPKELRDAIYSQLPMK